MNEERGKALIRVSIRRGHTTIDFAEDARKHLKKDELYYLYHLTDKIESRIRRSMFKKRRNSHEK